MRFKRGVKLSDGGAWLQAVVVPALVVADQVFRSVAGHGCTVTSVVEGRHAPGSKHYDGLAFDLRTVRDGIDAETARTIAAEMRDRLTDEFDIVVETTHIHVEYDPKH